MSSAAFTLKLVEPSLDVEMAQRVATFLSSVASDLAVSRGGHVPDEVVSSIILTRYTTLESVSRSFATAGLRFVLSDEQGEIAATVLVAKSPFIVLAKDSRTLVGVAGSSDPPNYHCLFNLAVRKASRRRGLSRLLLQLIESQYRSLLPGVGVWIRVEPPDHDAFVRLGFTHVTKYDGFFEETVPIPEGFESIGAFNARYACQCWRSDTQREYMSYRKYKYGAFLRAFGTRRE